MTPLSFLLSEVRSTRVTIFFLLEQMDVMHTPFAIETNNIPIGPHESFERPKYGADIKGYYITTWQLRGTHSHETNQIKSRVGHNFSILFLTLDILGFCRGFHLLLSGFWLLGHRKPIV